MKSIVLPVAMFGAGVIVGAVFFSGRHESPPAPAQAAAPADEKMTAPALRQRVREHAQESEVAIAQTVQATAPPPPAPVAAAEAKPAELAKTNALAGAINILLSPQASMEQKRVVWDQLAKMGLLDPVITELKSMAVANPGAAEIPTALGQLFIQKIRVIREQNADSEEIPLLGLQADQSFTAALKIDPTNWEAQFVKAVSMSYWPAEMKKGDEVIQRLSSLVDQQETMTPQPQFAQTYVFLGDQYLKMGKPEFAEQVWRLGTAKFPSDATLQRRLAGR